MHLIALVLIPWDGRSVPTAGPSPARLGAWAPLGRVYTVAFQRACVFRSDFPLYLRAT